MWSYLLFIVYLLSERNLTGKKKTKIEYGRKLFLFLDILIRKALSKTIMVWQKAN